MTMTPSEPATLSHGCLDDQDTRMIEVTVVVPTFRRNDLMRRAVASCIGQQATTVRFDLLVVDNCPDGSAADTVAEMSSVSPVDLRYVHEPRIGVPHARNAGLENSQAELVAFLDDDEIATPGWLQALVDTQRQYNADVVFGPVVSTLPESLDKAERAELALSYSCLSDHRTGTPVGSTILVPFWKRRGKAYPKFASGNVLIARTSPRVRELRFDPKFAHGGEDTVYFTQLAAQGASMVWCADAIANEEVPAERLTSYRLFRRAFVGGKSQSALPLLMHPRRPSLTLLSMLIGLAQVAVHSPLWAARILHKSPRRHHHMRICMGALGKIFWLPYPGKM